MEYMGTKNPVDLTGCSAYCQLRDKPKSENVKITGSVAIDPSQGTITATFTPAQTATLDAGDYGFDIRLESEGDVKTIRSYIVKLVIPWTELE